MADMDDLDLRKDDDPGSNPVPLPPEPRPVLPWLIAAVLIVAAGLGGWYLLQDRRAAESVPAGDGPAAPPASRPLGADALAIDLPPLSQTDMLVRTLAGAISSHPLLVAWLAPDEVLRRFTVLVDNIAAGMPIRQLNEVRPAGRFRVATAGGGVRIDPRGYERYAGLAAAISSVDAAKAAQLYATLKPRIEEAYVELGREGSFDRQLEQAIVILLATPTIRADEPLVRKEALFAFADPRIERLNPAQKHLLRMGPDHAAAVQRKLRELAMALGIPPDRLPR